MFLLEDNPLDPRCPRGTGDESEDDRPSLDEFLRQLGPDARLLVKVWHDMAALARTLEELPGDELSSPGDTHE